MKVSVVAITRWATQILQLAGVPQADARVTAEVLVKTEMRGGATHGLTRLPLYLERLANQEANATPQIAIKYDGNVVHVDADRALGQVAASRALDATLPLLATHPVVLCAIRRCGHLGALGTYALRAAETGAFAIVLQRTPPLMSMPGHGTTLIGNNPLAFGCPVDDAPPLVFDIACSVAARGHILLAHKEDRDIPTGWALNRLGQTTTDAQEALDGALLPMAGHKGLGLAMLVECLAGAMTGALLQPEPGQPNFNEQSAILMLVSPSIWVSQSDFLQGMRSWTSRFAVENTADIRIPGVRAAESEAQANRHGLALGAQLWSQLEWIAEHFDLPIDVLA